ncbi:hypothetical protein [Sphingobacterium sp. IITKGP-BTPF85]|nr:hypothetical protein [Sphingobacterium sp. IITKGP-BTPF85]
MNKKYIGIAFLAGLTSLVSCTKNFDELNTDPNKIEQVTPGSLITPTVYG